MVMSTMMFAALLVQPEVPPVPGVCAAPVPADKETPGCFKTGEVALDGAPAEIFWHIHEFSDAGQAQAVARRHRWASVAVIHSKTWLYVLGGRDLVVRGGAQRAVVGPLTLPQDQLIAHFAASIFRPGMRTRVHSHRGPEAFYVVEGVQCMDSPTDRQMIPAGGTYIVGGGLHMQSAPLGRRNLLLIIAPSGEPPVIPGGDWKPTGFCE